MTPEAASMKAEELCNLAPVIPVLVLDDVATARPLAEALVAGGLPVLEVTLRTPVALDVISEMSKVEGGIVGAGTLLNPQDVENAVNAGATFGVSPGATDTLLDACEAADLPLLPGAATSSEVMRLLERGYRVQIFPRRGKRRRARVKGDWRPAPASQILPNRRGITRECPDIFRIIKHIMCWRKLGSAQRSDRGERLVRDSGIGRRGRIPAPLSNVAPKFGFS